MLTEDILLKLRSRLKDEDYSDLRFSDEELIDSLNTAIAYLIGTLEFNLKTHIQRLDSHTHSLHLPYLLKIKTAFFNNTLLHTRTNLERADNEPLSLLVKNNHISVTPFKEGELRLVYNEFIPLSAPNDEIPLPFITASFLLYATLCNILEIHTQDENYNKIHFFLSMKRQEENNIIAYLNRIYAQESLRSKVVRV